MPPTSGHLTSLVLAVILAGLLLVHASPSLAKGECTDKQTLAEFEKQQDHKAMAYSVKTSECWWWGGWGSYGEAKKNVLDHCNKKSGNCRIVYITAEQKKLKDQETRDIKEAQTKLKELGLYSGKIDGKRGPGTIAAVEAFEQKVGSSITGEVSGWLLRRLTNTIAQPIQESAIFARIATNHLCYQLLNPQRDNWAFNVNVYLMGEARRRGLSVDDCRSAIGLSRQNADQIVSTTANTPQIEATDFADWSDAFLCPAALTPTRDAFSGGSAFASYVAEAKRRGLSVDDCRVAIGLARLENVQAEPAVVVSNDSQFCSSILSPSKTDWTVQPFFADQVAEAKRRRLSVDDCRVAIGLARLQTVPPQSNNISGAEFQICMSALSPDKTDWDTQAQFSRNVEEAKRRGLSVDDCRVAIGMGRLQTETAQSNNVSGAEFQICMSALSPDKTDWDTQAQFKQNVDEAKRRGLSVDDCRLEIGLAPLTSPPAQAPQLAQVDSPSLKPLSLNEICEQSLNSEKTDWSNASSASDARKQADMMGITVEICRVTLGIKDDQKTADIPAVSDQSADSSPSISPSAPLQKKVALVIGNSAYEHSPVLANPHNDAEAVAKTLTSLGFEVISGLDLTNTETVSKAREFAKSAKTADVSLLYYAGHGLQIAGENYIVPVDAKVEDETAISFELINVSTITNFMGGLDKVGIILLDACRDNPFSRSLKRSLSASRAASVDQGLAPISAEGGGLFVAFATAPGDVAADGEGMTNSPFTTALLKHLPTKGLEINTVMTRVKAEVAKMTKNDQRPWTNSDLTTEVYLAPAK